MIHKSRRASLDVVKAQNLNNLNKHDVPSRRTELLNETPQIKCRRNFFPALP